MTTTLPAGLTLRTATLADLNAVTELQQTCDIADSGEPDTDSEDILADWREEGFDLASASSLLIGSDGRIVGYTDIHPGSLGMIVSPYTQVHPAYRGLGLEQYLLNLSEQRALQYLASPAGASIPRAIRAYGLTEFGNRLLEEEAYQLVKIDWRMEIEFAEPPLAPQWPESISLRPYIRGQEERIAHSIIQEAFSDLAQRTYQPFEDWRAWAVERNDFDPSLLFLVFDNERPIGAVLGFDYGETGGWVRQLAILKPWQGRGIGKQFLRHVFGEFYRRGARRVGLVVDSENPSGATHFYQSVGMHVASEIRLYQKEV
ncbi:MAG TPA: GNAT family N-acetyltransferase [Ktedonosporobacter sp.]|nr:GNAT family N-acetyltransferase [Ktedonosporobacter sp.]